jgi:DNA helicase-2/ATP-dependent DNA helicase PcrA
MKKVDGGISPLMEEAVRLFYVGMTRAKRELTLLSYNRRDGEEAKESQFMAAVRDIQSPPQAQAAQPAATGTAPARRPEAAWTTGADGRRTPAGKPAVPSAKRNARGPASSGVTVTEGKPGEQPSERSPHALKSFEGLKPGDALLHSAFGEGEFIAASRETIEIRFGIGVRKLSAAACIGAGLLSRP